VKYKDTDFNATSELTPADLYPESYREQWEKEKINYVMQNMELIGDEEQFLKPNEDYDASKFDFV